MRFVRHYLGAGLLFAALGMATAYAQPAQQPGEADVAYFKEGGVLFSAGLGMRRKLLPNAPVLPFTSAATAYPIRLNSGSADNAAGLFATNPAIRLPFGRAASAVLSLGLQVHIEADETQLHFVTLRFGVIF